MKPLQILAALAVLAVTACAPMDNRYQPSAGYAEGVRMHPYYGTAYRPVPPHPIYNCTSWEGKQGRC